MASRERLNPFTGGPKCGAPFQETAYNPKNLQITEAAGREKKPLNEPPNSFLPYKEYFAILNLSFPKEKFQKK